MTRPDEDDFDLDGFFDAARAGAPTPSEALMARVLADAEAVRAGGAPAARGRRFAPLAGLAAALGGWPAVAGLASAAVAGLWIGVAVPDTVAALAGYAGSGASASGYDVSDLGFGGLVLAGDF